MRINNFVRYFADGTYAAGLLLAASALSLAGTTQALAIPSPELVVGSFVSISQLFALGSAVLGGGAAYATMRYRQRGGSQSRSQGLIAAAIGLFVLLCASIAANIYQYVDQKNERQARLESTLLRPSRAPAGLPNDPDAKELTFAQQGRHPLRISTEQAAKLLAAHNRGEATDYVFLDIRERAEQAMGSLKGATVVRFPDLQKANLDLTDKKVILFCHNGNRSSETAEAMAKMGIDAKFVVGGLEKWITEERDMEGMSVRSLAELRAIPNYPNRNTLLDTLRTKELVEKEKAILVDIRYPTDFAASHIEGAINLSLRRMPTDVMNEHIAKLPKRPIILPCYDRRGCFFAEVLGYELSEAGHDVRGRYTAPWEYFVARGRPPHVEAWIEENNKNIWARAAAALAGVMAQVSQWIGALAVIGLLALISRLLVLPFSLKAERDQIRARAVAGELDEIKTRLRDDPVRRTRAIRAFYSRHGMTPVRNLVAMLFLPIMAVALLAVQELATRTDGSLLWLPHLSLRDPWFVLPLAFGALITLYIDLAFATTAKRRALIWIMALPAMTATGTLFGAAADFYLIVSASLLLVQRFWVSGAFAGGLEAWRRRRTPEGIVDLHEVSRLAGCGSKAYRLAQMRASGMPVPHGVLLTSKFLARFGSADAATRQRELDWIWRHLGGVKLAVRSSALNEDGAKQSFAGVFESVLNVTREGLEEAIVQVDASFSSERASGYQSGSHTGNILVQRMVNAEYAGVLFTRDPAAGGLSMVELVQGTAENLVSGTVRPRSFRFGRVTGKSFGKEEAPIDLKPLLALGKQAERLFGGPQDIEWVYRDGAFGLVQSRDITRPVAGHGDNAAVQSDLARVIEIAKAANPDDVVFGKNEMSEMLPRPTPLSLSLMEALWAPGGSVDIAARELGLSYPAEEGSDYLVTVLGRLYVDKRQEKARALVIGPLAARRLIRQAGRIEREFREQFIPRFMDDVRAASIADFDKLSAAELVAEVKRLHDRFVYDTHVSVDVVNIAAGFYLDRARKVLAASGIDASALLGHIPETHESRVLAEAAALPAKDRRAILLEHFGHRAVLDYELSAPRYAEDLNALNRMIDGRVDAARPAHRETPALSKAQAKLVDVARSFQTLKEDAKHHSLIEFAVLRRAVLALDRRFGFDGRAFYLRFDEILTLNGESAAQLCDLAKAREAVATSLRKSPSLGTSVTAYDLEAASAGEVSQAGLAADSVRGTRVSGSRVVEGRVRVVSEEDAESGKGMENFRDGDIIVATMINPAWLPYFSRAGGFVSEVGGWLSHPAILAREYDVAMIVGTEGIVRIQNGSLVRLHLDGQIEVTEAAPTKNAAAA